MYKQRRKLFVKYVLGNSLVALDISLKLASASFPCRFEWTSDDLDSQRDLPT